LAPSYYDLLPKLKQNLGGHKFKDNQEVETAVTQRLIAQDMDLYQKRIEKLVTRYEKCLSCGGNYV
jgi:ferredoxin-like protein FixX